MMTNGPQFIARRFAYRLRRIVTLAGLGLASLAAWSSTEVVGYVSLAIGDGVIYETDGAQRPLARGAKIRVGDRVVTGPNGHAQLHFVDNGAVSVRPDSALQVQDYRFDAARPENSEVRLKLERGTGRSISGAATEVDKTRFRLNTPIAAIGVRGTDFIVQAQPDSVRAMVADGAIVMSPYSPDCSLTALGPCAGGAVRELTAEMGRWVAEVRPGDTAARLVRASNWSGTSMAHGDADGEEASPSARALAAARASGMLAAEPTLTELQRGNDRAAADVLTVAAVNVPSLNSPPPLTSSLVWGRWTIFPAAEDGVTIPYALARLNRHVTVADYDAGLFRTNGGVRGEDYQPVDTGRVEFRLAHAAASFESSAGIESAKVGAANLTVDFGLGTFATALDLGTASGAVGQVRASGPIRLDGLFVVVDATQRVAGALSGDGREAGYLFELLVGNDVFKGRTLWGRRP
jgi:hypothetical protein